jgi:3-hydroxybutyryl-CoA dehydrogenase
LQLQSGHQVVLYDAQEGAVLQALEKLKNSLMTLVGKGRLTEQLMQTTLSNIQSITSLENANDVQLVVEAIVEKLSVKQTLFQSLEKIVSDQCILATNDILYFSDCNCKWNETS